MVSADLPTPRRPCQTGLICCRARKLTTTADDDELVLPQELGLWARQNRVKRSFAENAPWTWLFGRGGGGEGYLKGGNGRGTR